jgi:outer membrane protein assembly factor BamB
MRRSMMLGKGIKVSIIIASVLIILLFLINLSASSFSFGGKTPQWVDSTSGTVNSVSMTPDQKFVIAGSGKTLSSGSITMFSANNGNVVWNLPTDRIIDVLAVSGNGSYIVAGGYQFSNSPAQAYENGAVYYLSSSGKLLWKLTTGPVFGVAMSSNGSRIAVDYTGGILYLNNFGQVLWNYSTSGNSLDLAMSSDGSKIVFTASEIGVSGSQNFESGVFLLNSLGDLISNYTLPRNTLLESTTMTSSGSNVLAASIQSSTNANVSYFDGTNGKLLWTREENSSINSLQVSSNGSLIAIGTNSGILFYDRNGTLIENFPIDYGGGNPIISANGSSVLGVVWGNSGQTVLMFNNKGEKLWGYSAGIVHAGAISNDGTKAVISAGQAGETGVPSAIYFFDTDGTGNYLAEASGFIWAFANSPGFWLFEYGWITITATLVVAIIAILIRRKRRVIRKIE